MNFKKQIDDIVEHIKDNFSKYTTAKYQVTKEFLDFDKYKQDFTIFVDFKRLKFETNRWTDDCRDVEELSASIYLVVRNDKSENLNEKILDYSSAFYKYLRKEKPDFLSRLTINQLNFYNYVEGNKYLMASEFDLSLLIEEDDE